MSATDLFELAQNELLRSNVDRRHPFRFFWLATQSDYPELRTVVKRDFTKAWEIIIFTDARSPKVTQIRQQARVSALFYHPKKKLQVRLRGHARLIAESEEEYGPYLQQVQQSPALKDYQTELAPGSPLSPAGVGLGTTLHFAVIQFSTKEIDILQLGTEAHQRVLFHRNGEGWEAQAIVP